MMDDKTGAQLDDHEVRTYLEFAGERAYISKDEMVSYHTSKYEYKYISKGEMMKVLSTRRETKRVVTYVKSVLVCFAYFRDVVFGVLCAPIISCTLPRFLRACPAIPGTTHACQFGPCPLLGC